jgi:hypothetical protein
MNEEHAKLALGRMLNIFHEKDIQYIETKFTGGSGFVEYQMRWIKKH